MSLNNTPLKERISHRQAFESLKFNVIGKEPSLLSRLNEFAPNQRLDVVGNEDDDDGSLPMDIDEDSSNEMEVELPLLQRLSGAAPKVTNKKDVAKPPHSPSPNHSLPSDSNSAAGIPQGNTALNAFGSVTQPNKSEGISDNASASLPSPPLTASGSTSMDASLELPAAAAVNPSSTSIPKKPNAEATRALTPPSASKSPPAPLVSLRMAVAVAEIQRIEAEKEAAEKAVLDLIMEEKCAWEDVRSTRNVEQHREELLKWHQMQQIAISSRLTPGPQEEPMPFPPSVPPPSISKSVSSSSATQVTGNEDNSSTSSRPSQTSPLPEVQNIKEQSNKEVGSTREDGLTRALTAEKPRLEDAGVRKASPSPIPGLFMSNAPNAADTTRTEDTPSTCHLDNTSALNIFDTEPQQQSTKPSIGSGSSSITAPLEHVPLHRETLLQAKPILTSNAVPQLQRGQGGPANAQISSVQLPRLQTSSAVKDSSSHCTDSKNTPSPVEREFQLRNRVRERTVSDKDAGERASAPAPSVDASERLSQDATKRVVSGSVASIAAPRRSNLSVPPAADSVRVTGLPPKPKCSPTPPSAVPLMPVISSGSSRSALGSRSTLPPSDELKPSPSSALKRKRSRSPTVDLKVEPAEEKPFTNDALLGVRNVKRKKEETPTVSFTKQELDEQKSQAALGDALAASISNEVAHRLSIAPPASTEGPVMHPDRMQLVRNFSQPTTMNPRHVDHTNDAPGGSASTSTAPLMDHAVIRQPGERGEDMISDTRQRERTISMESGDAIACTAPYSPRRQRSTSDRSARVENVFSRRNSTRSFSNSHSRSPQMGRREVDHYSPPPPPSRPAVDRYVPPRDEPYGMEEESRYRRASPLYERRSGRADTYQPTYPQRYDDSYREPQANYREPHTYQDPEPYYEGRSRERDERFVRRDAPPHYGGPRVMERRDESPRRAFPRSPTYSPPARDYRRYRDDRSPDNYRAENYGQYRREEDQGLGYPPLVREASREPPAVPRTPAYYHDAAPLSVEAVIRTPPRRMSLDDYARDARNYEIGAAIERRYADNDYIEPSNSIQRLAPAENYHQAVPLNDFPREPQQISSTSMMVDPQPVQQEVVRPEFRPDARQNSGVEAALIISAKPQGVSEHVPLAERLGDKVEAKESPRPKATLKQPRVSQSEGAGPSSHPSLQERMDVAKYRGRGGSHQSPGRGQPKKKDLALRLQDPEAPRSLGRGRGEPAGSHGRVAPRGASGPRNPGAPTRGAPNVYRPANTVRSAHPEPTQRGRGRGNLSLEERMRL
ncbi:hypothetical protein SCHPADRAFT_995855 [Schizopora paradoxa]|uniref:Uncharacterized protein n=1 Tax=Schizopora paradoxa TaxID=27342 RepID=A0A0H2SE76_9AGAM|nr:hypothetical protein SCHPADRAFT_995855 [Schizopora paradoxa]